MEYASFLKQHIGSVVSLTEDELNTVAGFFVVRKVKKKEYLVKEGQEVKSEFLVVKGLLKAFLFDDNGHEYIVQFAMENWWVSDYAAYKNRGKGDLCVQALEDCVVLELPATAKQKMTDELPKMHEFFWSKAFSGFVALQKRVISLMKNSAREKYELLLEQYPALFQRVSKTMIAHYLGVGRETLSRLSR